MECSATFIVILLSTRKFYQTVTPGVLLEVAFHTTKLIYGLHLSEGIFGFFVGQTTQQTSTCLKSTIETKQGVKYVQS